MKGLSNKLFQGKRKYIWIFILIISTLFFWFLRKEPVAVVEKTSIQEVTVKKTVSASGQIKSSSQADLSFLITGSIKNINVKKGDLVKKGDNLANINNYSNYMSLQQYRDSRDIALRDRDLFLTQYQNHQDQIGGPTEFEIQLRKQNETVSKAESAYKEVSSNITKTYIQAPFEGTVIDVTKEIGETASVGEIVIKLADLSSLIFEVSLDQNDFGQIKEGQKVEIKLDSYGDEKFSGAVSKVPNYVDGTNAKEFPLNITLNKIQLKNLLIGMTGDAYISVAETSSSVQAISFDQIYNENGQYYLWTENNGRLHKKNIEIGLEGDLYTEIKTPLTETIVIPVDSTKVKEGMKIKWKT